MPLDYTAIIALSPGATYWRADLHVHTPASPDFDTQSLPVSPEDIIAKAEERGIEILAVTDHNTPAWCDRIRDAAVDSTVTVFPGVEISTPEGHLVALFDKDTPAKKIGELLIEIKIKEQDWGKTDLVCKPPIEEVCALVVEEGGIPIAAHVQGHGGFLDMVKSAARRRAIYACPHLAALEERNPTVRAEFIAGARPGYPSRPIACIQSSDSIRLPHTTHHLDGIASHYTLIKLDDISIYSLKQAFHDPKARIAFPEDLPPSPDHVIEAIFVSGGFFSGQTLRFNDNLTCLIGGTGTGKSLALELIRFILDQRSQSTKRITDDISGLLENSLGANCTASALVRRGSERYLIERTFAPEPDPPTVYHLRDGSVKPLDDPVYVPEFLRIKAYSQNEIIEFARNRAFRRSLIDDLIEAGAERLAIDTAKADLKTNAQSIIAAQERIDEHRRRLETLGNVKQEIDALQPFLESALIQDWSHWLEEKDILDNATNSLTKVNDQIEQFFTSLPSNLLPDRLPDNLPSPTIIEQLRATDQSYHDDIAKLHEDISKHMVKLIQEMGSTQATWALGFEKAQAEFQQALRRSDKENLGLTALNERYQRLQGQQRELESAKETLEDTLLPQLTNLKTKRDELLTRLQDNRRAIRKKRQDKASELTSSLAPRIRIRIDSEADRSQFRKSLDAIKTGSKIHSDQLDTISDRLHPIPFVKALVEEEFSDLAADTGIDKSRFQAFYENIVDRKLLQGLYELQTSDVEDNAEVSFRIEEQTYRDLEKCSPGQLCTVVLTVAMAEGNTPLVVDQPEDALHAPFIEDYIVSEIRARRGSRQFIFATHNANILVSGDAEQIIVLDSDADRGQIVKQGSIDRFDTRDLVVLHLEGSEEAFTRRALKYALPRTV